MNSPKNFLEYLDSDLGINILSRLDDPAELARASTVARSWRNFVITNGFFKQFCLNMFPQLHDLSSIHGTRVTVTTSSNIQWNILERDHKLYALLLGAVSTSKVHPMLLGPKNCIGTVTNGFRNEGNHRSAYSGPKCGAPLPRSIQGHIHPNVAEILTYKITSDVSIVSDIGIIICKGDWEDDCPVCSATSMRLSVGHATSRKIRLWAPDEYSFTWTYTSPEFPLEKVVRRMQIFKLPEPVLCLGGILQIELFGTVEGRDDTKPLLYPCKCQVKFMGVAMESQLDVEFHIPYTGKFLLRYQPERSSNEE